MVKTERNTRQSHKFYKEKVENPVDVKTYIEIANGYMQFLMKKVIEGEEVSLPGRMGTLSIIGKKRKPRYNDKGQMLLPPDWGKTKKLRDSNPQAKAERRIVYHTNPETGGVVYKVHWSKMKVALENKTLFSLRITRDNKRAIHKAITQDKKEYYIEPN